MALRPSASLCRLLGNFFILFVLLVISFIYYAVVFIAYAPTYNELRSQLFLLVFHCLFGMLLWSLFQAIITDPGQVPRYWGFLMGDNEQKRRRYCLMCHVFKPERCHHCSTCNRCVLNMDHHCPWINNCVGFYNRKYFILLLLYVLAVTYLLDIALFRSVETALNDLYTSGLWHPHLALLIAYALNVALSVVLSFFTKFHLNLIMHNKTTIEMLDKKNLYKGNFDIGRLINWMQVFGRNPWLWFLPMAGVTGKPLGDGVIWRQPMSLASEGEIPDNEGDRRKLSVLREMQEAPSAKLPSQATAFTESRASYNSLAVFKETPGQVYKSRNVSS